MISRSSQANSAASFSPPDRPADRGETVDELA